MLDEIIEDVKTMPTDLCETVNNIVVPEVGDIDLDVSVKKETKDIFKLEQHKAWDKSVEARCDFQYRLTMKRRGDTNFIAIWKKSVFGRTLTDIKGDDDMVPFFVDSITPVINQTIGLFLDSGNWAVVTTPMRRHRERNFASRIAEGIARNLAIPFYFDCAHCSSRHRVDAVFTANNIPNEQNIIVFDDFVTTGSTLKSMRLMLEAHHKNCVFFCGINNKL